MRNPILFTFAKGIGPVLLLSSTAFAAQQAPNNSASNIKSQITFDLIHTSPECAYEGKTSTWCTKDDMKNGQAKAGMVDRINGLLDTYALKKAQAGAKPKVYLAYFSFSNSGVQKKLCELGKAGIPIEIVLDNSNLSQAANVLKPECQLDANQPNVTAAPLGGLSSNPWRLHHNKFLMIDPGDGSPVSINFSSGNLSSFGTSLHMDHWVLTTAPRESNFAKAHFCVIEGLHAAVQTSKDQGMYSANGSVNASKDGIVADSYMKAKDACYVTNGVLSMMETEKAIAREGVAPLFSPNTGSEVYKAFSREIRSVTDQALQGKPTYLYIAIQHFLHPGVGPALVDAANAGVDVRIVMDDDILTGESEVPGVKEFYDQELKGSKIKFRFAQTNASDRQMMHNKLAILNGKRTFSGAGHYTGAAFRTNWENFYLVENAGLTKKYGQYFKEIWEKSLDQTAVEQGLDKGSAPEALSPEFLKMVGSSASNNSQPNTASGNQPAAAAVPFAATNIVKPAAFQETVKPQVPKAAQLLQNASEKAKEGWYKLTHPSHNK